MSDFALVLLSLKARWLNSLLTIFLAAFGVMLAVLMALFGHHIQTRLTADGQDVDVVVGAKGSPLQLILSSVYHVDIPTGNILWTDAQRLMKNPAVKTAIPLALGDNWQGFRIVGTTEAYQKHYKADFASGQSWTKPMEAVIGSNIPLTTGDTLVGAHGLMAGGEEHANDTYTVVGRLKPTGTVLDRLILTSIDSVLGIHGMEVVEHKHEHAEHKDEGDKEDKQDHDHKVHETHDHAEHKDHEQKDDEHHNHGHSTSGQSEITALLLTVRSPIAVMNLPRKINRESALQAASPAFEMARLTSMLGLGTRTFAAVSVVLLLVSVFSIFSGLTGNLQSRATDLAVLRALGFSRWRIFRLITLEGVCITIIGIVAGVILGIGLFMGLVALIPLLAGSGAKVTLIPEIVTIIGGVLVAGLLAGVIPALRAAKVDTAKQLAMGF